MINTSLVGLSVIGISRSPLFVIKKLNVHMSTLNRFTDTLFYHNKYLDVSNSKFRNGLASVTNNERGTDYEFDSWHELTIIYEKIYTQASIKFIFCIFHDNSMNNDLIECNGGQTNITECSFFENKVNCIIIAQPYYMMTHSCFFNNQIKEGIVKTIGKAASIQYSSFVSMAKNPDQSDYSQNLFINQAQSYFHTCSNISSNQSSSYNGVCLKLSGDCFTMNRCTIENGINGKILEINAHKMLIDTDTNFVNHVKNIVENYSKSLGGFSYEHKAHFL